MGAWYEEAFRADYLRVYSHRDAAEAAAAVEAWTGRLPGLEPGARVLDLACGGGRHLRAMQARGIRAVGLDLSPDLLGEAARAGALRLARGDMRALPFRDGSFRAVTCFFTSFGYFEDERDDAATLREAARVLAGGGGLLLDLADPEAIRRDLVPRSAGERGGVHVVEERSLAEGGRRVLKRVTLREGGNERSWTESVRLYARDEVERLAASAGLRPLAEGPAAPGRHVLLFTRGAA